MKTMPDSFWGQAASFQQTATADAPARFVNRNLHRVWQLRRMKASLLHPFRKVLRPLLHWLRQEHIHVQAGGHGDPPVGLNLKNFGWGSIALSVILAPLAFLILLPLLILIFPVVACIGLAGAALATMQSDDDLDHHSLAWYALH